eukprot:COSAG02_NODE_28058_length_597_cov_0.935743_1_plen_162_part_00
MRRIVTSVSGPPRASTHRRRTAPPGPMTPPHAVPVVQRAYVLWIGLRDGGTESEISVEQVKNALRTSGHSIKAVVPRTNRCGNVDPSFVCTASHLERYARLASPMGGRGVWEQSDQHFSPEGTALRCGGICQRRHTRKAKHQPLTTTTTRHRSDPHVCLSP